jgi:hypothetical protein
MPLVPVTPRLVLERRWGTRDRSRRRRMDFGGRGVNGIVPCQGNSTQEPKGLPPARARLPRLTPSLGEHGQLQGKWGWKRQSRFRSKPTSHRIETTGGLSPRETRIHDQNASDRQREYDISFTKPTQLSHGQAYNVHYTNRIIHRHAHDTIHEFKSDTRLLAGRKADRFLYSTSSLLVQVKHRRRGAMYSTLHPFVAYSED